MIGNLVGFPFPNQIPYGRIGMQYFESCHPPFPVRPWNQLLGNNRLQHVGQLHTDLLLLMGRKYIDNPVHRTGRPNGMQGGQYKMPRLRCRNRHTDGLIIPHLPYQYHIRVFP